MNIAIKHRDLVLDLWVILFGIIGLFSIYNVASYYLNFQIIFFVVSILSYFLVSSLNFRKLNYLFLLLFVVVSVGLIYLHFFGESTRGSAAWISIGIVNFQPSEFSKIVVVLLSAKILSSTEFLTKKIFFFVISVFPILFLIFLEPDFGNFFVILFSILFSLFLAFINFKRLILLFIFLLISGFVLYSFVLKPYQKQRINSFFVQQSSVSGSNYNLNQSLIAIGSGGILGKGINNNSQVILNFLPEAHTDFIFASTSEIYGFAYSFLLTMLILLFLLYFYYKYIYNTKSAYSLFIAASVFSIFLIQVFLNIGMTVGILPITGITLPFISYGGSSLITFYLLFALVANTNLTR